MTHSPVSRRRTRHFSVWVGIILLTSLLLSACGGDPQTQQKANMSKTSLNNQIAHAQSIGVPDTMLKPIIQQELQISNTNAPLTLFSGQPATDYYTNVSQQSQMLTLQVQGLQTQSTQHLAYPPSLDLQPFHTSLAQRNAHNFLEA